MKTIKQFIHATSRPKLVSVFVAAAFVLIFGAFGATQLLKSHAITVGAPSSPPVNICNNSSELNGPTTAPAGAITLAAGDNSSTFNYQLPDDTTYYFAAGAHTVGSGEYSQIQPGNGDTFIGAPGAIIDGQGKNNFAFAGSGKDVTIEYLTIQNFSPPGNQGAINNGSADGWMMEHDTMQDMVPGTAVYLGTNNTLQYDCITNNGQQGWAAYTESDFSNSTISPLTGGPSNVQINDNEISYNNTCNWESDSTFNGPKTVPAGCANAGENSDCGCSGGGKFWEVDGGTFNDNYVHNNYSVGVWADTDNVGIDFQGNYISNNSYSGLVYEISYNAQIENNTFIGNNWIGGPEGGFPNGAVFISGSGSDSRVPGPYGNSFQITGNNFSNNWGGVILWEDSSRFCGSPDNTSGGTCTLVNPSVATLTTCADPSDLATTPYINDCRWKVQNVSVNNNDFSYNPASIGSNCTLANQCGLNGIFSEYGTDPSWSPYQGYFVPNNITNNQNNVFTDNDYTGPWSFMEFYGGKIITWSQWTKGWVDTDESGDTIKPQDAGSTFNNTPASSTTTAPAPVPPPSVPTNVSAKANSSTSVTVTWTASTDTGGPGLGGYDILRGGNQIASVNASTTSYTDTTAVAGNQYSYTVKAFDTASPVNTSAASAAATVSTPGGTTTPPPSSPPSTPTNVVAKANSATSVTVTWTASTDTGGPGLGGYYIIRNGVTLQPKVSASTTTFTDTTVQPDTQYSYSIEAVDTAGVPSSLSVASNKVTTPSLPDTTPPTQPTNLAATVVSSTQVNLTWTASTDSVAVSGYYVYRNGSLVATVTSTSYGDSSLSAGATYQYYVVAFNTAGVKSSSSTTVSVTTPKTATLGTFVGTVKGAAGLPVANVLVHTGDHGTASGMVSTYTNTSGQYVLSGLTVKKSTYFTFKASGYKTVTYQWAVKAGVTTKNVKLTLLKK